MSTPKYFKLRHYPRPGSPSPDPLLLQSLPGIDRCVLASAAIGEPPAVSGPIRARRLVRNLLRNGDGRSWTIGALGWRGTPIRNRELYFRLQAPWGARTEGKIYRRVR